jgi:Cu-processing system ATP-binding protein
VIVSSHILAEIELRADRIAILAQGRLVAMGSVFELRQQAALPARLWVQTPDASAVATLIASAERLGVAVDERTETGVWFLWPSEKKERALAWLLEQRAHWLDWAWRDATLEEVFFALALKEQTRQAEEEAA